VKAYGKERRPLCIALRLFVEPLGSHAIKGGELGVEQDAMPSEDKDRPADLINWNGKCAFGLGHRGPLGVGTSMIYDRNPQKIVESIFYAKPEDYTKARQRVYRTPQQASFIDFPVAP
jgi:hypothetical protein